jgi:CO/xanthine dehydrogenase Mo-binding subunit
VLIVPRGAGAAPADAYEAVELTSRVVITPDGGARLRIAQSETGHGVEAALAQVVAEELGLEWSRCETGFCDPQVKRTRNNVQVHTATLNSWAVDPLQIAGAQIRAMLVRAASAQSSGCPSTS